MPKKQSALAVVMGDIVASEAAQPKMLNQLFNRAITNTNKTHSLVSPLTITLGDEFQGLAPTLAAAWEIVASLRLRLLQDGVRCRFVIGSVRIETPINTERAWNMMGPGLAEARERLNNKQEKNGYRFSLPDDRLAETLLGAVGDSLTLVEEGWTKTQLRYYAVSRGARTNARHAASLGVSERAFYKVLRAARADFHSRQTAVIEEATTALDQKYGLK